MQQLIPATTQVSSSEMKSKLSLAFVICFVSIMFSGIASMIMSVYLPVVVKGLLRPRKLLAQLIKTFTTLF